ncbi:MAG: 30S ribosomal protein S16 [Candidatus Vogelbacteria bacterium]|nr:30S ribosomal protein S16 [Candidatus Vogelbacteria bacterium]
MLMIRLQRVGKKHDPSYRVVAVDSRRKTKSGNAIEVLGFYDARKGKSPARFDADRIRYWISNGAQLSNTVRNLLISKRLIDGGKKDVLPRKKMKLMEEERIAKTQARAESEATEPVAATEHAPETSGN